VGTLGFGGYYDLKILGFGYCALVIPLHRNRGRWDNVGFGDWEKKGNGCAQYDTYDCYDGEMDGENEELMEELR
jgi:hypothetical protein